MATSWRKTLSLANIALLNKEKLRHRFLGILRWVP